LPARQEVIEIGLPEGGTVADALEAAQVAQRFPELDLARMTFGIWGRACAATQRVRDGDRVEIYRALAADAKQLRRARAKAKSKAGIRR
jgi:putative ubiquitin-RnfH superfamily antitoxin RatB of RatAB toxin-antitoxin module